MSGFAYGAVFAGIIMGCSSTPEEIARNEQALFPYTRTIDCPPYTYTQTINNSIVSFTNGGDSSRDIGRVDTLSNLPELQWVKTYANFITAVIATDSLRVENNTITNKGSILWQWHDGMISGTDSLVKFSDGRTVEGEKILYDVQPLALESGLYYYAIWAWRQNGKDLHMSSRQQKFYVK